MITKKKIIPLFITLLTIILSSISFAGLSLDEMDEILDKKIDATTKEESRPDVVREKPKKSGLSLNSMDDLLGSDETDFDFDDEDDIVDESAKDVPGKQNLKGALGSYFEKGKKLLNLEEGIDELIGDDETDEEKSLSSSLVHLVRGNIVIVLIIAAFAVLLIILVYIFFYKIKNFSEQAQASKDLTEKYLYNFQEKLNGTKKNAKNLNATVTNINEEIDLSVSLGTDELDKILNTKVNNILHKRDKKSDPQPEEFVGIDTEVKGKPKLSDKQTKVLDSQGSEEAEKSNEDEFLINDLVHGSEHDKNDNNISIKEEKSNSGDAKLQKTDSLDTKPDAGLDATDAILTDNDADDLEMLISDDRESDFLLGDDLSAKPDEKMEEIGIDSGDDELGDLLDLDMDDVESNGKNKNESVKAEEDDGEMLLEDFDFDLDDDKKSDGGGVNAESNNNTAISETVKNGDDDGLEELLLEENPDEINFETPINTDSNELIEEEQDSNAGDTILEDLDNLDDLLGHESDELEGESATPTVSSDTMLIEEESPEQLKTESEESELISFEEEEEPESSNNQIDDNALIITEELELIDDNKKNETIEIIDEGEELIVSEKNEELTSVEESSENNIEVLVEENAEDAMEMIVEENPEDAVEMLAEESSEDAMEILVEESSEDDIEILVEETPSDNSDELISAVENGKDVDSEEEVLELSSLDEGGSDKETSELEEFELIEESDNIAAAVPETVESGDELILDEENSELEIEIEEVEVTSSEEPETVVDNELIIEDEDETVVEETTETPQTIEDENEDGEAVTSINDSKEIEESENEIDKELIDVVADKPFYSEKSLDDQIEPDKDIDDILLNKETEDGFTLIEGITSQHSPG